MSHPSPSSPSPSASPKPRSRKRLFWTLVIVLAAGAGLYFYLRPAPEAQAVGGAVRRIGGRMMPPPSVAVGTVEKGQLKVYINALGTVTPLNVITIRSRVDGELKKIHFTEGQAVKAGELLAEIDDRAYRATLAQAEGQLTRDKALLENAKRDFSRYENAVSAVTQQQLDTARATVAEYEGLVQADQGAVDSTRLQLSYCRITAPISGRLGLKLVDQGNLVRASDSTGIVVLTQEQPISVVYSVPEDNLPALRKALQSDQKLVVDVYDRGMKNKLTSGTLSAINNQIDTTTGTVQMRAAFNNDDRALFPNQFVNVRLLVEVQNEVVLIPTTAIQIGTQSRFVFVLKDGKTVERRSVVVGLSEGEKTAILKGVLPGEQVVLDSLDKLQDGGAVMPRTANAGGETSSPATPDASKARRRPATP